MQRETRWNWWIGTNEIESFEIQDEERLNIPESNDQFLWTSLGWENHCVEFCGRSNLLVVANWPRGGGNWHCNVGSPGQQNEGENMQTLMQIRCQAIKDMWGIVGCWWWLQITFASLQTPLVAEYGSSKSSKDVSSEQREVTCLLNILSLCSVAFLLPSTCATLPGLKKKHYVPFFSLQGVRSRSVPWTRIPVQILKNEPKKHQIPTASPVTGFANLCLFCLCCQMCHRRTSANSGSFEAGVQRPSPQGLGRVQVKLRLQKQRRRPGRESGPPTAAWKFQPLAAFGVIFVWRFLSLRFPEIIRQ